MERHEEIFFSLLRSSLWGTPAEVPHDFKGWGQVFSLAKGQSVLGQVGNVMISDTSLSPRFSAKATEKIKSFIMANVYTYERQCSTLAKSVEALKTAGLRPVLLKGLGLAAYYPSPNLRQCGDIDLYVGCADYRDSYSILKPLSQKIDDVRKLDIGIHFDANVDGTDIEVHRYTETYPTRRLNSIYQKASDKGTSEKLVPLQIAEYEIDTPSDAFNVFYVFSHMFRHFLFEGVGFRQICDLTMLLHARCPVLDRDELRGMIESMDMMRPWQAFGCLCVDVLGLPEVEYPFYDPKYADMTDKIVRRILDEGNFGKKRDVFTKKGKDYIINKARSFFARIGRTLELFAIFPEHAFRQIWHTLAESLERGWTDLRIKIRTRV